MMARLQQVAREEGLPFGNRSMTYNSRLAQELGKWAESQGLGNVFHNSVFRAYFAEGRNIGMTSELARLAGSVGLPAQEAERVIRNRAFREAIDMEWSRARESGVTAVPTFVLDGERVVGAQPYEVLEAFVKQNGIEPREESAT
jgi:predicted DsbA family dithiol-disulfide isomerase